MLSLSIKDEDEEMVELGDEDGKRCKCDDGNNDDGYVDLEDEWGLVVVDKLVIIVLFSMFYEFWTRNMYLLVGNVDNFIFCFRNFGFRYVLMFYFML